MQEKNVAFRVLDMTISAASLPDIGEDRIRQAFDNGGRITIVESKDGKWQNASSATSPNRPLTETIWAMHGPTEVAVENKNGLPRLHRLEQGESMTINAAVPHATRPFAGSIVVGLMSSDWKQFTRKLHPEFDEKIRLTLSSIT